MDEEVMTYQIYNFSLFLIEIVMWCTLGLEMEYCLVVSFLSPYLLSCFLPSFFSFFRHNFPFSPLFPTSPSYYYMGPRASLFETNHKNLLQTYTECVQITPNLLLHFYFLCAFHYYTLLL